jgi:predicted ATP-grasp superfamily ATP-dependent carboligase
MQAHSNQSVQPVPALILGLGHPRQTAYVKSLAKIGVPVHAAHTELNVYRFSRHLAGFSQLEPDEESQLQFLEAFGRATGGILVPTNDDYVAFVSRHRERLARHFIVPVPDWEIVGAIFDRAACYAKAASIGIKVPRYWCPNSEAEIQAVVSTLEPQDCDYIIKTRSILGTPPDQTAGRLSKAAPKSRADILAVCEELKRRTDEYPMIQEVVPGAADSAIGVTMVVSPTGEFVLSYCVRRLRLASYKLDAGYVHPYELGSVVWCETVHDDEALDAARELVKSFGYTGQITVEFRRDSRNGALYLMKVEPRPVRATSLSTIIGMDIPTTLYKVFTGGTPSVATDYPDGLGWLWTMAYAKSLVSNPHHNRRDVVRVLRGARQIKAFAEDFSDPVPLARWAAGRTARPVVERLRRLFGRGDAWQPLPR